MKFWIKTKQIDINAMRFWDNINNNNDNKETKEG